MDIVLALHDIDRRVGIGLAYAVEPVQHAPHIPELPDPSVRMFGVRPALPEFLRVEPHDLISAARHDRVADRQDSESLGSDPRRDQADSRGAPSGHGACRQAVVQRDSRSRPRLRARFPRVTPNDLRRTFASWLIQGGVSNRIVADLLGHASTRMVDLVYGHLDDATRRAAIARLPSRCDAGVPNRVPRAGIPGAGGATPVATSAEISVENLVPRVGIEPTTRGFSVRCSTN